jgi:hypothetical protein
MSHGSTSGRPEKSPREHQLAKRALNSRKSQVRTAGGFAAHGGCFAEAEHDRISAVACLQGGAHAGNIIRRDGHTGRVGDLRRRKRGTQSLEDGDVPCCTRGAPPWAPHLGGRIRQRPEQRKTLDSLGQWQRRA